MIEKVKAHFVTLPRWFALPAAVCGIVLGGILSGAPGLTLFLAVLAGSFAMAFGHSWNSYHDYAITGFDRGLPSERSKAKEYTSGQNVIAQGILSERGVLANALLWLALGFVALCILGQFTGPAPVLPWFLAVACAPWYSEAKKRWHPELPLGLGFSTFAVWLGMAASGSVDFGMGFLASIPLFILWGVLAETVDQALDWDVNWEKGLRNIGALVGRYSIPYRWAIVWFLTLVYLSQIWLISIGILSSWTGLTFLAAIPVTYCALLIDSELKKGIWWGLGAIFLYQVLLVVGQAVG